MVLLVCFNPLPSLSSPPPCSSSTSFYFSSALAITASPVSRLHLKAIDPLAKSSNGAQIYTPLVASKRGAVIVKVSSNIDGGEPPSNSTEEVVPVDKLPLESKMQERMEQKMRMKLVKKIRLRRKRLVRKRRMREEGPMATF